MPRLFYILSVFLCLVGFASCDEDTPDESDVAVIITPTTDEDVTVESGDKYIYKVELYTKHKKVERLRIKSKDVFLGERTLVDTLFVDKESSYSFVYDAPSTDRDSLNVTLTFNAWDDEGNICEVERRLIVKNKQVLIGEKSGIVLYNPNTGKPDALCMTDPSQTFNWQNSPDSVKADIYIEADNTFNNVAIKSRTATKFVRNNSFDYASATTFTIQAVYSSSVKTDNVDDIRINDIIIAGHGITAEGVFRIVNVARVERENEQCIQLAFKSIAKK